MAVNPLAAMGLVQQQQNPLSNAIRLRQESDKRAAVKAWKEQVSRSLRGRERGAAPAAQTGKNALYGGMSAVPVMSEQDTELQDRRDRMREAFLERLAADKTKSPGQYAEAEKAYDEMAGKRGRFLKKAYDTVGTPEGYSDLDVALMRTTGLVNPLLDEYNAVTRDRVAKEFQKTHKWARNKNNLADLDVAVKYLMSRPDFEQSFYYNP